MKTQAKVKSKFIMSLIVFLALLLIISAACEDPIDVRIDDGKTHWPEASFIAGPEGGYFKALDGNVELFFPENAITEKVDFYIEEGSEDEEGDFVIQSILIEPLYLEFMKPVSIVLRYDGCLANGKDPCKAQCLALYHFENDKAFDARHPQDLVWIEKCGLNVMDRCIETKIHGGGVYAIGEASMDPTKH